MVKVHGGIPEAVVKEATLFAFDDYAIPFRANLETHLVHGKSGVKKTPIVLANGKAGDPDEHVHYYGTTIRIGDTFHMWYIGRVGRDEAKANYEGFDGRVCYATSRDGVNWERPDLGLVEFRGARHNNLVDLPQDLDIAAGPVLYDPEDPDPGRRFKINFEAGALRNRMCVAYSPDGLRWTPSPNNPVGPSFEQAGLVRFNGCYYVNGQGGGHPGQARKLMTYASYDFERWTPASVLSMNRAPLLYGPAIEDRKACWEEVHLGAALHPRGNVILGIYGMWHGDPYSDRRNVTMDLGLVISHDVMHFQEPIPGFRFIPSFEEHGSTVGYGPALMQGQGMENVGDKTLYWYSLWRDDGQVRLAQWTRDRFGYVKSAGPRAPALLITCPMTIQGERVFLNVEGPGEYAAIRVEALDLEFQPLPGYSGADAAVIRESGLRVPVRWKAGDRLPPDRPMRLKADFGVVGPECVRPEDTRLYAMYVAGE
jgi:hypothetical protein